MECKRKNLKQLKSPRKKNALSTPSMTKSDFRNVPKTMFLLSKKHPVKLTHDTIDEHATKSMTV